MSVVPFIEGGRVLEIGHGPGHLQRALLDRGLYAVGIDESAQMGRQARRNLERNFSSHPKRSPNGPTSVMGCMHVGLVRGLAQYLPFASGRFDSLVATFPAGYIFDPITLQEAYRVLSPGGRFVILPGATILGRTFMDKVMALIFRITGETPPNLSEVLRVRSEKPLSNTGFTVEFHELEVRASLVEILVARKSTA